ncbi:unnamed protein product [Closterium sp. Yama58-4]|nr:unnamed protein product [Closterium sp. Yama58-4]
MATAAWSNAAHALRFLPLILLSLVLSQAARPAASQSSAAPRRLLATETPGNPVYIVRLKGNSVAAEINGNGNGGNNGNGGGNGGGNGRNGQRQKIDRNSQRVKDHVDRVKAQHARVARGAGVPDSDVLYSYVYSTNGLAARLSKEQKRALEADPEVAYVQESKVRKLDVLDSPNFLNLPNTLWKANTAASLNAAGAGTVIGIVDTGIWPEHPSFQDQSTNPYPNPPATWTGKCQTTSDFPKCTRKLIGAQYFIAGFLAAGLTYYDPKDWLSPRDVAGHGTWCAEADLLRLSFPPFLPYPPISRAAAGNGPVSFGSLNSVFLSSSYGVTPRAFLPAYKVSQSLHRFSSPSPIPSHSQSRSRQRPRVLRIAQLRPSRRVLQHPLHPSPPVFTLPIPFVPLHFLTEPRPATAPCPSGRSTPSSSAHPTASAPRASSSRTRSHSPFTGSRPHPPSLPHPSLPILPPSPIPFPFPIPPSSPIPRAAAGNGPVSFGSINSVSLGSSYGVAPRAFLAMYKVSWYSTAYGGRVIVDSDIYAAVDTAVADGVDVLSLSLGGMDPSDTYFDDLGYLDAHLAGVVVVKSASNYGPPPFHPLLYRSISNFSPFFLTVGASSISRRYNASLTLGNGTVIYGNGFGGLNMGANTPLIDAAKIPAAGYDASTAQYCKYGSLDTVWVAWRMVVCLYGGGVSNDEKALEVSRGKGLAVLIVNVMPADDASFTRYGTLPAMTLFPPNDAILTKYLLSASPTGTMSYGFTQNTGGAAATMAYFSSIGPLVLPSTVPPPSFPTNDILKPDIIAPGYNLWGAAPGTSPGAAMSTATKALMSGTSMSTPHVAGIAALIMQNKTDWTPSQVMSAIMTTATVKNNKGVAIKSYNNTAATPWQMGAGHVDASKVLSPGLTYSLTGQDFYNFLAGQNLTIAQSLVAADAVLTPIPAYNLNRPTISVGRLTGSLTVTRTVTSVGSAVSTYNATVVSPTGVTTVVTPKSFTIAPGESVTFNVTFKVVTAYNDFRFGSLTWKDGKSVVTSQIAVVPWSA